MKKNKLFLLLGATLILTSCGGVKYTELTKGAAEYDEAVAMISQKVQTPTDYKSAGFTVSISGMTAAYGLSQKMDLDMAFEVAMNDDSIQGYISMENEGNYLYLFVIQNSEKVNPAIMDYARSLNIPVVDYQADENEYAEACNTLYDKIWEEAE